MPISNSGEDGDKKKRKKRKLEEDDPEDMSLFFPSPLNVLANLLIRPRLVPLIHEYDEEYIGIEGLSKVMDWDSNNPMYPDDIMKPDKILIGKRENLESLFSNRGNCTNNGSSFLRLLRNENGDPSYTVASSEEALRKGKHIIISFFIVPLPSFYYRDCRSVLGTYSDLRRMKDVEIEMVIVPKMARGWEKSECAFNHFVSGLPEGCLVLNPFDPDNRCRIDYVGKALEAKENDPIRCLVLNRKHKVVLFHDPVIFADDGASSFPFTEKRNAAVREENGALARRLDSFIAFVKELAGKEPRPQRNPVSLDELLQCSPSDCLYRAGAGAGSSEQIPVSNLNDKTVGVYFCYDGKFMNQLSWIHQLCVSQGKPFEIVVFPVAIHDDPRSFVETINLALVKRKISSWWALPFHDALCRRLWGLVWSYFAQDELIVLHPESGSSDLNARMLIDVGVSAYPFTREVFVQKKAEYFRSLNLDSLVRAEDLVRARGSVLPVVQLRHKKVLLFFYKQEKRSLCFKKLVKWTNQVERFSEDYAVVFIPLHEEGKVVDGRHVRALFKKVRRLPWFVFPSPYWTKLLLLKGGGPHDGVEPCETLPLKSQLFPKHLGYTDLATEEAIFAFDSEGRILSTNAQRFLRANKKNLFDSIGEDNLLVEMCAGWCPNFNTEYYNKADAAT